MELNWNERLRVVIEQIVPAIIEEQSDKTFQLNMLDKHQTIAMKLNTKVDKPIDYIPEFFAFAKEEVHKKHREKLREL